MLPLPLLRTNTPAVNGVVAAGRFKVATFSPVFISTIQETVITIWRKHKVKAFSTSHS
jgi:hypothetical protein